MATTAHGAVESSTDTAFVIKSAWTLSAAPTEVYARFLEIGKWWSDSHTFSGSAANMSLKAQPGGCFCETLPGGGFVEHSTVVYAAPGKSIQLKGAIGPLLPMGGSTHLTVSFQPEGKGTKLTITMVGMGYEPKKGLTALAPAYDAVLTEQFGRLKKYAGE